jgi:multiple sugar transport system permease protein
VSAQRQRVLFLLPFALIVTAFTIWPAIFGLAASLTNYAPFQRTPVRFVGLTNYANVLKDSDFQAAIRNITLFTAVTVVAELTVGVAVGYTLREPFRGRSIIRFMLLIPWLLSPVANGVMWHYVLNTDSGLLNFWPALLGLPRLPSPLNVDLALLTVMAVDIWRKTPLVIFLVLPGILAIPAAQWDLAELEGMATFTRIRHIVLPRLRLLLLTITLLLIGDALGTSDSILILTGGGPASATMTPGLYSYRQALNGFDWITGSTSAWLIAAAVLLVGLCYLILTRREANR